MGVSRKSAPFARALSRHYCPLNGRLECSRPATLYCIYIHIHRARKLRDNAGDDVVHLFIRTLVIAAAFGKVAYNEIESI